MVRTIFSNLRASARQASHSLKTERQQQAQRWASSSSSSGSGQQKASDALASAQKGLQQAADVAKKIGDGIGNRVGIALGSYREPLVYNLQVAKELLKQIYVAERLQPPTSLSTITNAYSTLWHRASNPNYWREILRTGEWKRVGVYAVEAYGIFKIGEILGRRHLVGYKLD